jgi:sodium transport system permease protein
MKKELRRFFGDRRMLATIILPGVLIYVIYSLMGNALSENLLGGGEDVEYRVPVHNNSETMETIVLNSGMNMTFYRCPDCTEEHDADTIAQSINSGAYHLYVVFPEDFDAKVAVYDPASGQPAPEVKIFHNSADQDSSTAYSTLLALLSAFESSMANRFDVNISPDTVFDVATEEDVTGMIFSMLMPLLLVMLTFSSCMAMTVESIAGEKERGTIATLLITPVKRSELAIGKIAALSVISLLAGLCNFLGVLLALPKLMGGEGMDAGLVDASVYGVTDYLMILGVILSTVLVFVSLIAILSALAASVKEASGFVSPLMIVVTVVGVSGMFTGGAPHPALFCIPVYNSVQCISGIFSMSCEPINVAVTVAVNLLTAGLFAWVLARMFHSERVMFKK